MYFKNVESDWWLAKDKAKIWCHSSQHLTLTFRGHLFFEFFPHAVSPHQTFLSWRNCSPGTSMIWVARMGRQRGHAGHPAGVGGGAAHRPVPQRGHRHGLQPPRGPGPGPIHALISSHSLVYLGPLNCLRRSRPFSKLRGRKPASSLFSLSCVSAPSNRFCRIESPICVSTLASSSRMSFHQFFSSSMSKPRSVVYSWTR